MAILPLLPTLFICEYLDSFWMPTIFRNPKKGCHGSIKKDNGVLPKWSRAFVEFSKCSEFRES